MKEKYKNILTGALIPIIAYGVYCYGKAFKTGSDDAGRMRALMQSSPRVEYVVQRDENLFWLRGKFFPIKEEFKGLDSIIFHNNRESYKQRAACNIWTQIVKKENDIRFNGENFINPYYVEEGKKISVPARETCQTIK